MFSISKIDASHFELSNQEIIFLDPICAVRKYIEADDAHHFSVNTGRTVHEDIGNIKNIRILQRSILES
jgi:hypothetical protein